MLFGFEQSRENGNATRYEDYTVPALVRNPRTGELLAIVEGQAFGCEGHGITDQGDTDLVQRRSTDQGLSWGPVEPTVVKTAPNRTEFGNQAPLVTHEGHLYLLHPRFLSILSPFRSTDSFGGAGTFRSARTTETCC